MREKQSELTGKRGFYMPLELHEHVIRSLDNWFHGGTIANCAIVCRAWLPASRRKLYSNIELRYCRQWNRFKNAVVTSSSPDSQRCLDMIKTLVIWPVDDQFFDEARTTPLVEWSAGPEHERPWSHHVLIQCAGRLVSLKYLTMVETRFTRAWDLALESASSFASLTSLKLDRCEFLSFPDMHRAIISFPALTHLVLDTPTFDGHSLGWPERWSRGGDALRYLDICARNEVLCILSDWLSESRLVRNLSGLTWSPSYQERDEHGADVLIDTISDSSLQELTVKMPQIWDGQYMLML